MKPSRAYHHVSSLHREPGGLRTLDILVSRLDAWRGDRSYAELRILHIGCGSGDIVLPLASLGCQIIGLDADAHALARAKDRNDDLDLLAKFLPLSSLENLTEPFDIIIEQAIGELPSLADRSNLLTPGGMFLVMLSSSRKKWSRVLSTIHDQGFKPREVSVVRTSPFLFSLAARFFKAGSSTFNALDQLDARCADAIPLGCSRSWIIDVRTFDAAHPLIMQIVPSLGAGGAERIVLELGKRLAEHNYATQIVSIVRGGEMEADFTLSGLDVRILHARFSNLSALFALRRLISFEKPAIVHTHLFGADVYGRLAAWLAKVKVIITTEHSSNGDHGFAKIVVKRLLAPLTSQFIAVSAEARAHMIQDEHLPERKILVIRNGIDMERVIVRAARPFATPPKIIVVARLISSKGHTILLEALSRIDTAWRLVVVGSGEEEERLRIQAEHLNILSHIEWLGYRTDVPQLLAAADIFCFPSYWEGLGLALIEASAAGLPIIASDIPSLREVIDPQHARFVKVADVAAFTTAITAVLQNPDAALARAREILPTIHQRFSIERMVVSYVALYNRALADKKTRA